MRTVDDIQTRLRAEFVEMPDLRLTAAQVQRLCGVEGTACHLVLRSLVEAKFLSLTPDGAYVRFRDAGSSWPSVAKAGLRLEARVKAS
jgi:hypothetical protein